MIFVEIILEKELLSLILPRQIGHMIERGPWRRGKSHLQFDQIFLIFFQAQNLVVAVASRDVQNRDRIERKIDNNLVEFARDSCLEVLEIRLKVVLALCAHTRTNAVEFRVYFVLD